MRAQRLGRKRPRAGVQADVRKALEGEVRSVDIDSMQESRHESDDSEEEGAGARSNVDPRRRAIPIHAPRTPQPAQQPPQQQQQPQLHAVLHPGCALPP